MNTTVKEMTVTFTKPGSNYSTSHHLDHIEYVQRWRRWWWPNKVMTVDLVVVPGGPGSTTMEVQQQLLHLIQVLPNMEVPVQWNGYWTMPEVAEVVPEVPVMQARVHQQQEVRWWKTITFNIQSPASSTPGGGGTAGGGGAGGHGPTLTFT